MTLLSCKASDWFLELVTDFTPSARFMPVLLSLVQCRLADENVTTKPSSTGKVDSMTAFTIKVNGLPVYIMFYEQLLLQLQELRLSNNQLVGILPEKWSNLANVSPVTDLTSGRQSMLPL